MTGRMQQQDHTYVIGHMNTWSSGRAQDFLPTDDIRQRYYIGHFFRQRSGDNKVQLGTSILNLSIILKHVLIGIPAKQKRSQLKTKAEATDHKQQNQEKVAL